MKYLIVLVFWVGAVQACEGLYFSVHAGKDISVGEHWTGDVPVNFVLGHNWMLSKSVQFDLRLLHDSNLDKGWPVNEEYETSREAIQLGFTVWAY